jgi:hypothetical protein
MNVTLTCDNPIARIVFLLGEDAPTFSGGYGGWSEVERPKRSPIAHWNGSPARRLELSLILDGFASGRSVDTDLFVLSRLATASGLTDPPKVRVEGEAIPGQLLIEWVIEDLTWQATALDDAGARTRVGVSLTLLEAVNDDLIERSPRKRTKTYKVKKGDTLATIAASQLGLGSRWREVLKLNPKFTKGPKKGKKRRATKDVVVGEVLRLP